MGLSENDITELENIYGTFEDLLEKPYYLEEELLPIINKHMSNTANLIDKYLDKKIGKEKVITYIDSLISVFEDYLVADFAKEFKNMFNDVRKTFNEISKKFEEKGKVLLLENIISEKIIIPQGYSKLCNCLNNERDINDIFNLIKEDTSKEDYKKLFEKGCNPDKILVYPIAVNEKIISSSVVEKSIFPNCVGIYCKEEPPGTPKA